MCSNYIPVTRIQRLMTFFGVEYGKDGPSGVLRKSDAQTSLVGILTPLVTRDTRHALRTSE